MKVVLIDDELLALSYLEHQLQDIADIDVAAKFVDPEKGTAYILDHDVDVAFLDIHLPEVNGVELAERLLERKPKLNVVFCTAYDEYAIKAFELNALDYLMKPVGKERLAVTLQRIQERLGGDADSGASATAPLRMKLFQQVLIEADGKPLAPIRWRTAKAQELFLYLLQHRGQLVRKSALVELLWPEYEPNKAFSQLYTAVYHIRKTLEPMNTRFHLSNATEGYILDVDHVRLDVEEWEQRLQTLLPVDDRTIEEIEQVMAAYTGDYLQDYEYVWAESERFRLKLLWVRAMTESAEWYASCRNYMKAIEKYFEICNRQPLAEEARFALMKLYAATNNHLSVHRQYRELTTVLLEEVGERPSPYITEWYLQWKMENKE
ncbi:response regulator [Paenibacillus antri]|uniref:Response regulator n=1 Tax=Paenibacillus antri TaxID=2582848 RepID=A0A5R9FYF8_9BACL|nr:response regulator [Paenibacillus antri]TLS48521.1 response regulator [Paenibacillus antri]